MKFIFLPFFIYLIGCGVKGKPLPPINPAPLYNEENLNREDLKNKNTQKNKSQNLENEKSIK